MIVALSIAMTVASVVVWPASSLENIYPTTTPGAERAIHLSAARGEWESVQICIRSERDTDIPVRIDASDLAEAIPAPRVYLVRYATLPPTPQRPFGPLRVPDVLVPGEACLLPSGVTQAFWLTYMVPLVAEPGTSDGEVVVHMGDDEVRLPVSLDVFGFSVPAVTSLRSLVPINRARMAKHLRIAEPSLDVWRPVYDELAQYRLSFSIWDSPDVVPRLSDGTVDVPATQQHLQYLVQRGADRVLDAGFGPHGLEPARTGDPDRVIPPADVYVYDMAHWLRNVDWTGRALVMVPPPATRAGWQQARQQSFEVFRAEPALSRLMRVPLHPFFERYVNVWALTLDETNPYAIARLREGQSLRAFRPADSPLVTASGSGSTVTGEHFETVPADAFDGSFFSHWTSGLDVGERHPWIQIDLQNQVATRELRIGWVPGHEAEDVRIRLSFDGRTFNTATALWEHTAPGDDFQPSWSRARFSSERRFVSVRLEFRNPPPNSRVAIADLLVTPALEEAPAPIQHVQPWLATTPGRFPSMGLPGNPAEPRLLPWVCWAHKLLGVYHAGLANWPDSWDGNSWAFPKDWPVEKVLMYPHAESLAPSVRLMRLRDGFEDYEYLRNLEQMAMLYGIRNDPDTDALRRHPRYDGDMQREELLALSRELLERRNAIGNRMNALLKREAP